MIIVKSLCETPLDGKDTFGPKQNDKVWSEERWRLTRDWREMIAFDQV